MKNLEQILKKRIINFGPISISDFILEANLNSNFGYYTNNLPFGEKKDYITSPEISQMFGELIAVWSMDCWIKMGSPRFDIIELGPGSGVLMKDFIRTMNLNSSFTKKCKNIYLFEISPHLKRIQERNIAKSDYSILKKVKWIKNLENILNKPFILIANEFFDSLPIKQMELTRLGWRERMINYDKEKKNFFYSYSNKNSLLERFLPKEKKNKKIGSIYEIPINMIIFLEELFKKIKLSKSVSLIIDYSKKESFGNSLKSIKKQKIHHLFDEIGKSDISSHVDFNLIKEISKKFNLKINGPENQKNFLLKLGILLRAKKLMQNASNKQKKMIKNSLDFLTHEKKMGKIFNVISISNKKINNLVGF